MDAWVRAEGEVLLVVGGVGVIGATVQSIQPVDSWVRAGAVVKTIPVSSGLTTVVGCYSLGHFQSLGFGGGLGGRDDLLVGQGGGLGGSLGSRLGFSLGRAGGSDCLCTLSFGYSLSLGWTSRGDCLSDCRPVSRESCIVGRCGGAFADSGSQSVGFGVSLSLGDCSRS